MHAYIKYECLMGKYIIINKWTRREILDLSKILGVQVDRLLFKWYELVY